jgi:hypothetical protein
MKRFQDIWFDREHVLAAVLHPHFQLQWIKDKDKERLAKEWLYEEYHALRPDVPANQPPPQPSPETQTNPLFDFDTPHPTTNDVPVDEIEEFLAKPNRDLSECFKSLPTLKQLFIRFNTPVPSSATLERAFSLAKRILSPQRGQLSDERFETTMILSLFRRNVLE